MGTSESVIRNGGGSLCKSMPVPSTVLLVVNVILLQYSVQALNPDGEALLVFKKGIKASDGVLAFWREKDKDPCQWPGVTCNPYTKRVIFLNLPYRKLSGYISPSLGKLDQLRRLGLHHNSLLGPIPRDLGKCSGLMALYLEENYLSGHIPDELGRLSSLMILDFSSNSLTGRIPVSLGNLQRLTIFNVSTNFLNGEIPGNGVLKKFSRKSFVGNLGLCGQQVDTICIDQLKGPSPNSDSFATPVIGFQGAPRTGVARKAAHHSAELVISVLGTVGLSLLVALMCFWGWFLYHKTWKKWKSLEVDKAASAVTDANVVCIHGDLPYTSKEIVRRIESLTENNIIGYGGFGTVYMLEMEDGRKFAVKKVEKHNVSFDGVFQRELEVLGSIKHRNLVNLRGYCNAPSARLLIYDYLPMGSLNEVLHDQQSNVFSLPWGARLKIAIGAAQGLAYLHHDCSPRIIHRDIKSSNILLGESLDPHVSDFGLAKLLVDNESHVTTGVAGSFGYLAPEYLQNGRATEKTDIYSYGVVLLELLSGKLPTDSSFVEKGLNIIGWVTSLIKEKQLKDFIDPQCENPPIEILEAVLGIAVACVKPLPQDRPTMNMVVKMLEAEIITPCPSFFYESNSE